jgi:hypothetical protein
MINEVINIDKDCIEDKVIKYFSKICRFDTGKEKYKKMLNDALVVRARILDKMNIRVITSSFEKECLYGKTLTLNGVKFYCNAFEQFKNNNVKGIYSYVLTAGDIEIEPEPILDMFYADTWGTAYVDAARDFFREIINDRVQKNNGDIKTFVSDSFGPGYYGMTTDQVSKFFEIMDVEKIGMKLTKYGMMLPLKSCTGVYIVTDDEKQLPKVDCKKCISNPNGCQFCGIKKS